MFTGAGVRMCVVRFAIGGVWDRAVPGLFDWCGWSSDRGVNCCRSWTWLKQEMGRRWAGARSADIIMGDDVKS